MMNLEFRAHCAILFYNICVVFHIASGCYIYPSSVAYEKFMDGTTQQVTLCFIKDSETYFFSSFQFSLNFFNLRFRLKFRRIFFLAKIIAAVATDWLRTKQLKQHFQERTLSIVRKNFCNFLTPVLHFYEQTNEGTLHKYDS